MKTSELGLSGFRAPGLRNSGLGTRVKEFRAYGLGLRTDVRSTRVMAVQMGLLYRALIYLQKSLAVPITG